MTIPVGIPDATSLMIVSFVNGAGLLCPYTNNADRATSTKCLAIIVASFSTGDVVKRRLSKYGVQGPRVDEALEIKRI